MEFGVFKIASATSRASLLISSGLPDTLGNILDERLPCFCNARPALVSSLRFGNSAACNNSSFENCSNFFLTIQRLSQLLTDLPMIQELDLNPVIAYEDRVTVVDARIAI